jgi:hypothetical protein
MIYRMNQFYILTGFMILAFIAFATWCLTTHAA